MCVQPSTLTSTARSVDLLPLPLKMLSAFFFTFQHFENISTLCCFFSHPYNLHLIRNRSMFSLLCLQCVAPYLKGKQFSGPAIQHDPNLPHKNISRHQLLRFMYHSTISALTSHTEPQATFL